MIDLTKKALPNTIVVDGKAFSINTDYRIWIRFMHDVENIKAGKNIDVSYIFVNDMPSYANILEILEFANPKSALPRQIEHSDEIMFDFEMDSDLIYSAFMGQYGIDLVDVEYLHWHKFLALFKGLTGTKLNEVMGYRGYKKNVSGDQYEKLKSAWRIEKYTEEDQEEIKRFESLFD